MISLMLVKLAVRPTHFGLWWQSGVYELWYLSADVILHVQACEDAGAGSGRHAGAQRLDARPRLAHLQTPRC